jgi:F0F1-type ATP synthase assembly protein I
MGVAAISGTLMKPDNDTNAVVLLAVKVIAQLGAFMVFVIGGAVLLGLLLDQLLGTKPIFIFTLLLGSIPVTLWIIYRYSLRQSKHILSSQKEDDIQ